MQNLSKAEQSRILELMCRGKKVQLIDMVPSAPVSPHTGYLVPTVEQFGEAYLAEIMGDQVTIPVMDEEGYWIADAPLARKRGQEWRDEIELQESGEIVGYWGEGQ